MRTAPVIGAEIQSTALDITTEGRNTAVIFGDGAGAVILQPSEKPGILSTHLHSDGRFAEELYVKDPGSSRPQSERQPKQILDTTTFKVVMNGNQVFKHAVVRFMEVINEALAANHLKKEEINLLVPHQANLRISQYIQGKLALRDDQVRRESKAREREHIQGRRQGTLNAHRAPTPSALTLLLRSEYMKVQ